MKQKLNHFKKTCFIFYFDKKTKKFSKKLSQIVDNEI